MGMVSNMLAGRRWSDRSRRRPLTAAKRELLEEVGLQNVRSGKRWADLGSKIAISEPVTFLARHPTKVAEGGTGDLETYTLNWVPLTPGTRSFLCRQDWRYGSRTQLRTGIVKIER